MKKILALLLVLVLCAACIPAMAEGTQTYTHPTHGYSIEVPAEWLCVDKNNVQGYIEAFENGEMTFTGTNAMTLEALKPQLETSDCAVLINPYANNVVIVKENMVMAFTQDLFVSMVIPMLKKQLSTQMPSIQFTAEGEILTLGDKDFILLAGEYSLNGIAAAVDMLFYLDGEDLYTINLTTTSVFGQDVMNDFYADVQEAFATFRIIK